MHFSFLEKILYLKENIKEIKRRNESKHTRDQVVVLGIFKYFNKIFHLIPLLLEIWSKKYAWFSKPYTSESFQAKHLVRENVGNSQK